MNLSFAKETEYRIYLLLSFTRDEMRKVRAKKLNEVDILPEQASILALTRLLGEETTPTTIGQYVPRTSQTICGILNRMEKKGLIVRKKKGRSARATHIELTETGLECAISASDHSEIIRLLEVLSLDEMVVLESLLTKIYDAAKEINEKTTEHPVRFSQDNDKLLV